MSQEGPARLPVAARHWVEGAGRGAEGAGRRAVRRGPRAEPGPGRPGWARQGRGAAVQASDGDPGPRAAGVGSRRRAFTWPLFLIKITAVIADLLKILHLKAVFSIIFP